MKVKVNKKVEEARRKFVKFLEKEDVKEKWMDAESMFNNEQLEDIYFSDCIGFSEDQGFALPEVLFASGFPFDFEGEDEKWHELKRKITKEWGKL